MNFSVFQLPVVILALVVASVAAAQSIAVSSDDPDAQECYRNGTTATFTPDELPDTPHMLDPCNRALLEDNLNQADRAATHVNRGIILARRGELAKALADYGKAEDLRPEAGEIYVNRGFIYLFEGQYPLALAEFNHGLELQVVNPHMVYMGRGLAYEGMNRLDEAEAAFRRALVLQPDWERVENYLSDVRERRRNKDW